MFRPSLDDSEIRDLARVLHEPALLDRVRVVGGDIQVIAPKLSIARGSSVRHSRLGRFGIVATGAAGDWRTLKKAVSTEIANYAKRVALDS